MHSFLDDIAGIGPKRRKALMKKYVTSERMSQASIEDLADTESMTQEVAEAVYTYFHPMKTGKNDIQ